MLVSDEDVGILECDDYRGVVLAGALQSGEVKPDRSQALVPCCPIGASMKMTGG